MVVLRCEGKENITDSLISALDNFNFIRSNVKPINVRAENTVWMILRPKDQIPQKTQKNNLNNQNNQNNLNNLVKKDKIVSGRMGAYTEGESIFIVAVTQSKKILDPDMEFLELLQKIQQSVLQTLLTRVAYSQIRNDALLCLTTECKNWKFKDKETLFMNIVDIIHTCFFSSNVYIGLLSMRGTSIEFVFANNGSKMKGKKLIKNQSMKYNMNPTEEEIATDTYCAKGNVRTFSTYLILHIFYC